MNNIMKTIIAGRELKLEFGYIGPIKCSIIYKLW